MRVLIFFMIISSLGADIKSTNGSIGFDVDSDGQREVTLNQIGLGIGISPSTNLHVNGNASVSEKLFIGTSTGQSNLNLSGSFGMSYLAVSANTILDSSSIILADTSNDNILLTLPYAGNVTGRTYTIKKTSLLNSVWLSGGGNLIDDRNPIELSSTSSLPMIEVISDGLQSRILNEMSVPTTIAADNLIAWWKLDETSGNTASDSSGSGIDLTLDASLDFSGNGANSVLGRTLTLDGVNDSLEASESPIAISSNISRGTLSAWIKTSNAGANHRGIIVKQSAYGMYLYNNEFQIWDWSVASGNTSGVSLNDDDWHHVAITFDSGVADGGSFYVDGAYVESFTMTVNNQTNGLVIGAGNNPSSTQFFKGMIDDARVYNKILSPAEIQALYQIGL